MEFFIAFANFALAMWLAWRHEAPSAVYVFFAGLVFAAAIYLRHANTALPLSF
jgi:formate hydrogenlyase subunit 3/multisubunit Na+/H+ antiporter MnhD subunit